MHAASASPSPSPPCSRTCVSDLAESESVTLCRGRPSPGGRTFALLVVRLIKIEPVEQLLRVIDYRLKGQNITVSPMFYLDDGVISTSGAPDAVDYAAGAKLRKRPTQDQRRRKACKRRKRISWKRGLGGEAARVARGGALAEEAYGAEVGGLSRRPPRRAEHTRGLH